MKSNAQKFRIGSIIDVSQSYSLFLPTLTYISGNNAVMLLKALKNNAVKKNTNLKENLELFKIDRLFVPDPKVALDIFAVNASFNLQCGIWIFSCFQSLKMD